MHVYGETYMLHTSASVRQSVEQVMPDKHSTEPISVVSESVLDLESGHRTTACEVCLSYAFSWLQPSTNSLFFLSDFLRQSHVRASLARIYVGM